VSSLSVVEIDDRWMQFGDYIALVGKLCVVSGHFSPDYLDWLYMISHPFMSPAQSGNPPRVPPVQQDEEFVEPDMYQQLMAAAVPNEADIDQHHLRHVVVILFFFVFFVCFFVWYLITNNCYVCFISLARMTLQQLLISWTSY